MDLNHLARSQISNPHFSSNPKSQIESQIFHKNGYANRFSIQCQYSNISRINFRLNHTVHIQCQSVTEYGAVLALNCIQSSCVSMICAFHFAPVSKQMISRDLTFIAQITSGICPSLTHKYKVKFHQRSLKTNLEAVALML